MAGVRDRIAQVRAEAEGYQATAQERWLVAAIGFDLFERYRRLNGPALAGHVAFRMFSWLLPLTLIVITVTGLAADSGVDVTQHGDETLGLGESLTSTLAQASDDTSTTRLQFGMVAVSGLLLGTSGLLSALHLTHSTLWEVPDRRIKGRGKLLGRMLGGAPLLLLIILASSALRKAGLVGGLAGTVLAMAVVFGMFVGLGWILPRRSRELRDLVPGAAVGTGLVVALQIFAQWYLAEKLSKMSDTYGAFGLTLTLLAYLFLLGQIVVTVVLVNAVLYDRRVGGTAEHVAAVAEDDAEPAAVIDGVPT